MRRLLPQPIRSAARFVRSAESRRNAWHEWRRRRGGPPPLPDGPVGSVLVLCKGNVCRSPYAEAALRRRAPELEVASAGLAAGGGDPAHPSAIRVAAARGVDLSAHRTRALAGLADRPWDLCLVMDGAQSTACARRLPALAGRVRVLGDWLPDPPFGIADPWGLPDEVFERTFQRLDAAVDALLAALRARPA